MDLDVNTIIVVIVFFGFMGALVWAYYRRSESKVTLTGLRVDDLLGRIKEAERLFMELRNAPCFFCHSDKKQVSGNLYEEGSVKLTCDNCGAETSLIRKKNWNIITQTKSPTSQTFGRIREKMGQIKSRE